MDILLWVVLILVALLFIRRFIPVKGVTNITSVQLNDKMKNDRLTIIDVREPHEFKNGHIKGAVNIPLGQIDKVKDRYPQEKELYLVCLSGNRSMVAARKLKGLGYTNLYNVLGGMSGWRYETTKR